MNNNDLRRLRRKDLVELMLVQAKEIEELKSKLAQAQQELADRKIRIEKAGSIAEASLQLSGIFQAAQEACSLYTYNMEALARQQEAQCARLEQETRVQCNRMLESAQKQANACWEDICRKIQQHCDSQVSDKNDGKR